MTERREIKQRSPTVWARVREAYLAGEPAASVARRFDVGYGNLRHRAYAEGWTRKAVMAREETEEADEMRRIEGTADDDPIDDLPFVDPETARQSAIDRAGALLAAGRGAEATVLLKAAEAFTRLTDGGTSGPREGEGIDAFDYEALQRFSLEMAVKNAEAMLGDTGYGITSAFGHAAYHWRAANLGPEIARHDFDQGVKGGWAGAYWEDDGSLKPLDLEPKSRW